MSSESDSDDVAIVIETADQLKGDDFFLLGIPRGVKSRAMAVEVARKLVPGKNIGSYCGAAYAAKKNLWTITDSVFALTDAGEKALRRLEAGIGIGLMTTIDATCREVSKSTTAPTATEVDKEASPRAFVLEVGAQIEVKAHLNKSGNSHFNQVSKMLRDEWDLPPSSRSSIASVFGTDTSIHSIRYGGRKMVHLRIGNGPELPVCATPLQTADEAIAAIERRLREASEWIPAKVTFFHPRGGFDTDVSFVADDGIFYKKDIGVLWRHESFQPSTLLTLREDGAGGVPGGVPGGAGGIDAADAEAETEPDDEDAAMPGGTIAAAAAAADVVLAAATVSADAPEAATIGAATIGAEGSDASEDLLKRAKAAMAAADAENRILRNQCFQSIRKELDSKLHIEDADYFTKEKANGEEAARIANEEFPEDKKVAEIRDAMDEFARIQRLAFRSKKDLVLLVAGVEATSPPRKKQKSNASSLMS
jgi:hypothetical protein